MQMEITHTINHSQCELHKIQLFLENSIAYQNQTLFSEKLQALLLSLKEQKTEDNS